MKLYLVQHGEALSKDADRRRPLSDRGREVVDAMATWAARVGVAVDRIHHSGKERAAQTAQRFAERLSPSEGVVAVAGLEPMADARSTAEGLAGGGSSMLVGHLPHLARLAGLLLAGDPEREVVRFQNAAIVCLSLEGERWALHWMMTPELLPSG